MLLRNCVRNIRAIQRTITMCNRTLSSKKESTNNNAENAAAKSTEAETESKLNVGGDVSTKYRPFKDEESNIIFDVYEETEKLQDLSTPEEYDPFEGINLERGLTGVYDIEELVAVLNRDNAENIFVASLPADIKYVDYICIVTGKSSKHMQAIAQFVRKVYKKKMHSYDHVPVLEGKESKDWMAIDLGNIALHIFSREARLKYDLDMLWSVGSEFDNEYNKQDPIVDMLEKHSVYLKDLQPAT